MPAQLQAVLVVRPTGAPCSVAAMPGRKKPEAVAMGRRIAAFREKRGLNQSDLARRLRIKVQSVQQWESGQTQPRANRLRAIAEALGCSVHALTDDVVDHESLFNEAVPLEGMRPRRVPLVAVAPAGMPHDSFDQRVADVREPTVPTFYPVSHGAFALRVFGDSMEPIFPDGCIIVVEPSIEPKHGMYVVVRLDGTSEHTFKQLIVDGPHRLLKPLNSRYPIIELNREAVFCGVVVESFQRHVQGGQATWT